MRPSCDYLLIDAVTVDLPLPQEPIPALREGTRGEVRWTVRRRVRHAGSAVAPDLDIRRSQLLREAQARAAGRLIGDRKRKAFERAPANCEVVGEE